MAKRNVRQKSSRAGKASWRSAFIEALGKIPNISVACDQANVSRQTAYKHRRDDKGFAEDWDDAITRGIELLEASLWRRAAVGVRKSDVRWRPAQRDSSGQLIPGEWETVGEEVLYDTTAAIFLLKAHAPKKYRERYEVTGPDEGPIKLSIEDALDRAYGPEKKDDPESAKT